MASSKPGDIVRTPRDDCNGQLRSIESHKPYMDTPDKPDEELGELLNEQVDQEPRSDFVEGTTKYESNFEEETSEKSDFVEGTAQYESDFEEETSEEQLSNNEAMTVLDIGHGVQMITTPSLAVQLRNFKADKWSVHSRNSSLNVSNLRSDNKFVSNVYKLSCKSKLTNISNPHEKNLMRKKKCVFSLLDKYKDQVWFRIQLDEDVVQKGEAFCSTFSAWIECGDEWKSVPATFKDGYIEFACCRLNSFAVVCRPTAMDHILTPAGAKICTAEGRTIAEFEPETVDIDQKLKYTIKRPNHNNIKQLVESNRMVIGVSDRISITQCDKSKFKKQMTLSGTLENGSDFDSTVEVVGFVGNKPVLIPTQLIRQEEKKDDYKSLIDICDRAAFVQIRKNGQENDKIIESLKDEIDVAYGDKYLCKILLFYQKRVDKMMYFTAECCFTQHSQEHIQKQDRLIYESDELCLPPHQRIRIHPAGCLQHALGSKSHIFLFFMYVAYDNRVDFTVEISKGMNRSVNATLEFSADNQNKGVITTAEFSLDSFYGGSKKHATGRPLYKRIKSTMSDVFRQQPSTPRTSSRSVKRSNTVL